MICGHGFSSPFLFILLLTLCFGAHSIEIEGESRIRFESLSDNFRKGFAGSDQLILLRNLAHVTFETRGASVGVELQDSRTYLGDNGTPLTNSFTNPLDILQLYVERPLPGSSGAKGWKFRAKLGRQTLSLGSKRQIERVSFANVIKSYTGAYISGTSSQGAELHSFYVVPIARSPSRPRPIIKNHFESDKEQWQRRIWGLHLRHPFSSVVGNGPDWVEGFVYGLNEKDDERFQTANRHYTTFGFRLYRSESKVGFNYDVEAAIRKGSRRLTSTPSDNTDLKVNAQMLIARFGFTFDHPWQPNIAFQYYYASGDKSPEDGRFDQYERLFGGRRTDLNNTSIHGPLTPANLSAPGVRLQFESGKLWDARIHYSRASLAKAKDRFVIGQFRDITGASGSFLGHTIDTRWRRHFSRSNSTIDLGYSYFSPGPYLKQLDETSTPTHFGYVQWIKRFSYLQRVN